MQALPNQITDANVRALAQQYRETFTGTTGTDVALSYTPAATLDNVPLISVYRNGVLMSESGGGGGTQIREVRTLTGTVVDLVSDGAGTATATTGLAHTLQTGNTVDITGATQPAYDITATITLDSSTGFDYPITGTPVTPATGTIHWMAQSFYLLQQATSAPELLFINGALRHPNTYTRTEDMTGTLIDLGSPLGFGDTVVIWYLANGGGYTIAGKTLTFDSALTSEDTVVVSYQYRN